MSEKILIIDTSTEACSAALSIDGQVSGQFEVAPRNHTKLILPMIDSILSDAKIEVSELTAGCVDTLAHFLSSRLAYHVSRLVDTHGCC